MKKLVFEIFTLVFMAFGNEKAVAQTANLFKITGAVESEAILNADSLARFKRLKIDSTVIFNHLGQRKSTLKNLEVVLLRDALSRSVIKVEGPKQLSEFYFVCEATDGYKAVFSWNEVFNNPLGDSIFIIVSREGKSADERSEGFALLSPTDNMTGRRYVKNLEKIMVRRAE